MTFHRWISFAGQDVANKLTNLGFQIVAFDLPLPIFAGLHCRRPERLAEGTCREETVFSGMRIARISLTAFRHGRRTHTQKVVDGRPDVVNVTLVVFFLNESVHVRRPFLLLQEEVSVAAVKTAFVLTFSLEICDTANRS